MKLKNAMTFTSLAAAAMFAAGIQAADPDSTNTVPGFGSTDAEYAGGATINGEASFISTIPAGVSLDLVGVVTPAPADVGETGDILVVVQIPGEGFFQYTSTGLETLPASEESSVATESSSTERVVRGSKRRSPRPLARLSESLPLTTEESSSPLPGRFARGSKRRSPRPLARLSESLPLANERRC